LIQDLSAALERRDQRRARLDDLRRLKEANESAGNTAIVGDIDRLSEQLRLEDQMSEETLKSIETVLLNSRRTASVDRILEDLGGGRLKLFADMEARYNYFEFYLNTGRAAARCE